jgi:hypothetical protein
MGGDMVDQTLITSGFDIEVLLSGRYFTYALLAQIEAGQLATTFDVVDPTHGLDVHIELHPPTDYERRYDPEPSAVLPDATDGSFETEFIVDDPDGANVHLSVVADILDRASGGSKPDVTIGLMLAVDLRSDVDPRGFESNQRLSIALVKLDPLTKLLLTFGGLDVTAITAQIKAQLDRTVPFGVASGQSVQRAVVSVLPGGGGRPAAMGIYIDLALKNGPQGDAFVDARGDIASATNFLDDGMDIAFATSAQLYGLLGADIFHRMAEEDPPGSGSFRYPMRETPGDPESNQLGSISSVTVGPELVAGQPTGSLLIDVSGEYRVDNLPDPSFHLLLTLRPVIRDGILTWDVDATVDVGILGSLLSILAIVATTLILGPGVGVTLFLLLLAADLIVDAVASAVASGRADDLTDASFLDAIPTRTTCAQRRWDPLYATRHEVVALLDRFDVTKMGLAFDGAAVLDREPAAVAHAVIRDEERAVDNAISGLRYRVRDLAAITGDLAAVAPGTDRRPYSLVDAVTDPRGEANLVALTLAQVDERITGGRVAAPILYLPERIHLDHNTIRHLMTLSQHEIDELRSALIDSFRRTEDARVRADQGSAITQLATDELRAALGREPTQDEIDTTVNAAVKGLVDSAQATYERGDLEPDLEGRVAHILRFDLAPSEFAALQNEHKALAVAGKEIIRMRGGTVYYRDHPDFVLSDNLLELDHYRYPYQPPAP